MFGIKDVTGQHQNWVADKLFDTYDEAQNYADELNEDEERRNGRI